MAMVLGASVYVPVPIERAWALWVDAARYPQWQGAVLAVQEVSGPVAQVGTTYVLDHGPKLKRHVRVVAAEPPVRHVIEQAGVGVRDQTVATFAAEADGTRVTVTLYLHLNAIMRLLAHLDRRSRMERELQRELDRFVAVARRHPGPARPGGVCVVASAAARRRVTVLDVDADRVHVRLHPGHLRHGDPDDLVPRAPKPPSEQMDFSPIPLPLRASFDVVAQGLPFLLRDGGHGVAHLALSMDAWADASAREVAFEGVTAEDLEAVDAWRARGRPTVGVDADLGLAMVCTLRIGVDDSGREVWGTAKILRSEIMRVHLAIAGDRWTERPERIAAWRYRVGPISPDAVPDGEEPWIEIGHIPLKRTAFLAARPGFVGITTLESNELEGYRIWREHKGGTFDTLEILAQPPLLPLGP